MRRALTRLALPALVMSCRVHQVEEAPRPALDLPERFAGTPGERTAADAWWKDFGDPRLDATVEALLAKNLDLAQAWARLAQAAATARKAGAALYPELTVSAGGSYEQGVSLLPDSAGTLVDATGMGSLSVGASYEIDLWGRVASTRDAAALDASTSRQDLDALAMTLAARVVGVWFELGGDARQLALLHEQIGVQATFLEIVELRFQQGHATVLDVLQQRRELAATQAQVPLVEARLATGKNQLAVLLGQPPEAALEVPSDLPPLPALPAPGLPTEVLARRPDVEAARLRVVAADHRVGAAIADQFPALKLGASTGLEGGEVMTTIFGWVWGLVANLVAPIFDAGRRSAEVDRTRAALEERVHGYAQAVLSALAEVEDALSLEERHREYLARVERERGHAQAALRAARTHYRAGLTEYLGVLTAVRGVHQAELARLQAQRQLYRDRVQLHRALGGTWTRGLARVAARKEDGDDPPHP